MASSPRIRFESTGLIENDVICSLDNEYLLWYMILQELITALNGFDKRLTLNAALPVTLTLRDQTLNREDLLMLCVKVMERLLARMELSAA